MRITRVIYNNDEKAKALAVCTVVLDDCLKLTNIRLYSKDTGYYLTLPSKQDIYKSVKELNKDIDVVFPVVEEGIKERKKQYEEFFYPVELSFYEKLLETIVSGYSLFKEKGKVSYRPKE